LSLVILVMEFVLWVDKMPKEKEKIKVEIDTSEMKTMYTCGVFGGLSIMEGHIVFFQDRPNLEIVGEKMKVKKVIRKAMIDVKMSPAQFKTIAEWMMQHVKEIEKKAGGEIIGSSDACEGMHQ